MEFCWALPLESDLDVSNKHAIKADNNNFNSILVSNKVKALDPWITTSYLCNITNKVRILVAQNPNIVDPHITAKAALSINQLYGNRVDINIVAGGSSKELLKSTKDIPHSSRYDRVSEYTEILRDLFKREQLSIEGKYFSYDNYELYPKNHDIEIPRLFVAGSSNEAMKIGAEFADNYVIFAEDIKSTENHFEKMKKYVKEKNRSVKFGIFIAVIARNSDNDALETINQFESSISAFDKKMKRVYLQTVESKGIQNHKKYINKGHHHEYNLWSGLSEVSTSLSMTIVGSYEKVISTIEKYRELGVNYFLLTSFTDETEIDRIGQYVLPYLD
ncbi:LLM class flavin-dependent oxidoreductase [Rossellomorea vietnamensis]|uniref:LLM class flavin-dependent oxidoreductase n=1 Tax=Rossellomorea vietnamensis TaxID=218284 RepID=A0A6I6UCZ2_9BACI|nr:LLM class flavin-dependent oxidoreductase [Rossellomorea vietnamensis]QHE59808.1 LLM class flavin-dependent oxidoreductase [Rossellomorea vietnamensis]